MNSQTLVRRADPRDQTELELLVVARRGELQRERPTRGEITRRLQRLLRDPSVTIGVAAQNDVLLGYAVQRRHLSLWTAGGEAVLEDLFVTVDARRRGLGRRLVEHAVVAARTAGCAALVLAANERNDAATALYEKTGFECTRPEWAGGRELRYVLGLIEVPELEAGIRWGPWFVKW